MDELDELRLLLNDIDKNIMDLLEERYFIVDKVKEYKKINKIDVLDKGREEYILNKINAYDNKKEILNIYEQILILSKDRQND